MRPFAAHSFKAKRFIAHFLLAFLSLSAIVSPSNALDSRGQGHNKKFAQRVVSLLANRTIFNGDDPAELQKRDGTKYVFMHHIVGNTYPYTQADWADDFQRIAAKGVDAVALNIGADSWEPGQVASAYAAAQAQNSIKCFISFDFTSFPCSLSSVVSLVNQYASSSAQFLVNGRPMISSFEGGCLGNSGWASIKSQTNGYVMPFISGLEGNFNNWPSLDSWYCWGCAWPQGNYDKNIDDDQYYISQLGLRYATTVSPWFYTHYSYKNFILRADDWLLNSRWEQLMSLRSQLTFVEMVTWNDYGESHYLGPIKGQEPSGTTWADNFPHTAWFDMSQYYITAFKTGSYPAITQDVIYYWARPHPASASASGDSLPQPTGASWTQDYLWAVAFATSSGSVTLSSGGNQQTFSVNAGVTKLKLPLAPGSISVAMIKAGVTVISQTASNFQFITNPVLYNFNVYVGSATATTSPSPTTTTTTTAASPTSSSWSYVGCYYDPGSSRVLSLGPMTSNSQTVSTCLASCLSQGYAYGGTEYGVECWCGAAIAGGSSTAPAGDCNQPCSGKSSDVCGAGNRISLYHLTAGSPTTTTTTTATPSPTPSGWGYVGCYVDPGNARVLPVGPSTSSSQTVAGCLAQCSSSGYAYGGTEYGVECWCGAAIAGGSAVAASGDCNQPCSGKSSDICGAGNRLSLYHKTGTSSAWSSAGCYIDDPARILRGSFTQQSGMTTEVCQGLCAGGGYSIAGTQYATQCFCDSQLYKQGGAGVAAADGGCNMPCAGNGAEICGGSYRMNMYVTSSAPPLSRRRAGLRIGQGDAL